MHDVFEGRASDHPYVEAIWRGRAGSAYAPVCPASSRWHLLFLTCDGSTSVSLVGPLTRATPVAQPEGTEWLGVTFTLGTFLPSLPIAPFMDTAAILPDVTNTAFSLAGSRWQLPDYENIETLLDRLARERLLLHDPVVRAALEHPLEMPARTVRHRFLRTTGLPQGKIRQIERARLATILLEQGMPILDTVDAAGYADQAHLTRSLTHFMGQTPARLLRASTAAERTR